MGTIYNNKDTSFFKWWRNTKSGRRYLADICFPTLKLYYEIDELQHSKEKHKIEDSERKKEIIDATGFVEKRIKIYNLLKKNRKLKDINYEVDKFVKYIKKRKKYSIQEISLQTTEIFELNYNNSELFKRRKLINQLKSIKV